MQDDPTIARIRQVRHDISEEFGHDAKRLVAHYIEYQEQFADRLLREPQNTALHRTAQAVSQTRNR
jgi:hypothetical protein